MRNLSNPSKWLNKVLNCLSHQIRVKCAFYSLRKCENQMHLYKRRGKNFNSSSIFIYYFTNLFWRSITLLCTRFFTRCIYDTSHFWFLVTFFGDEVTKIQKYYIIFVYILQGNMGKMEKNRKKITQLK